MLYGLDLWRAAQIMVGCYGDGAATEAAMRADEFLDQGNLDGKQLWVRIMQASRSCSGSGRGTGRRCIEQLAQVVVARGNGGGGGD